MASQNVVFAIDVDYRPEESNSKTNGYQTHLKHWILRVLLSLGHKYGLEKVRWGYKFFHSRTVKSATLITRGSDFKELQEKVFSDFEEELLVKFSVKSPKSLGKSNKLKPSPASCVQNALKEILLDFQWDRPDLTSPTKVTLRPRRSSRSGRNIPLQDYDMLNIDKNILFVVSECPRSKRELEDYLSIRGDDSRHLRDIHEQLLPKGLIHMLMQRKVMLNWADSGILKANHVVEDYTGIESLAELLRQVGGQVVPMLSPRLPLMDQHSDISHLLGLGIETFPIDSTNSYLQLPERMHQQVFPPLGGSLSWIEDGNRQSCSVTLEPVSCRQRFLRAPVDVVLRGVLQDLDTICLSHSASESWILQCTDAELGQEAFQHLKQLSTGGSAMLADVSEGGVVCSAVLLVLSSCTAQLTVLQPLVTQEDQLLPTDLVSLDTTNDLSSDLPDVVSSVLNVMFDIMEDEDLSDQVKSPFVPDWASQDLKQGSCSRKNVLVEGWFPLSDQSGISCDLMESMRLLHAAPEEEECGEEYSDNQQEITSSLSELYQSSTSGSSGNLRSKKRGTQCTPVRQKMKTMCRSLQMLNFARLNVKAQKTQGDSSSAASAKGAEKGGRRCSGDRMKPGTSHFNSEEELITHLGLTYQKAVENRSVSVPSQVQDMLSVVKAFIKTNSDVEVSFLGLVQKHLLKSSKFIRQLYENSSDEESKIRECQLQAVLQLELCRQSEQQENEEAVEQRIEEVADMLRIISRSKDAVYLSKFMQDEVLPVFLNSIPKVLADVYHSLGTQLPEALVAVLPSDFFSDESMAKDSVSVSPSLFSATHSNASSVRDHLEELRNRSAKKRRQNILTRHKSMAEAPQALRQIEMPRKSTRLAKPKLPLENPAVEEPPPPKQAVQEVTKVRRNLFNQVAASPSKKSKMPRSQSVSAVEGLKKRKRSHMEDEGRHTLLTKKVSETPLHKQVSNRLLHRQRTGRRSGESDVCIIEESPIKPATDLRRSPRIKSLTRRHSSVFYSSQQPRSRNLDRAISSSQLCHSEGKEGFNVSSVRSPVRILFGATQSSARLRHFTASSSKDHGNKELSLRSAVFESQNKTPQKLRSDPIGSAVECRTPQSPRTPCRTVGENGMTLRGSFFQSPAAKSLVVETPKKSPLKGILKTPMKSLLDCVSPNGASLRSPNCRTPKKSVTWSPSPRKCLPENQIDVPESPMFTKRYSPRLITHGKNSSPEERNVFKTPDKVPQLKSKASPGTMPRALEMCVLGTVDPETSESITRSGKMRRTLSLPCKITEKSGEFASVDSQQSDSSPFPVCASPLKPNIRTPIKSPSSTHRMCTRSGRTPVKESLLLSNKSQAITGFNPSPSKGLSVAVSKLNMSPYSGRPRTVIHPQSCSPTCIVGEFPQDNQTIGQNELNHGKAEEVSSSDSQQFDRSEFSITTDDESIDISEASVVKTQLTGGIKMNIAFSRKPSRSSEVFEFKGKQVIPVITTPSRSYGFRQTPDRRQREAEARLGYSSGTPKISTPKTQQSPACGKMSTPQPLTYEVEMEMQASGLPKLKLRRTDSFSTGDAPSSATKGMASHLVHRNMSNVKAPQVDSPLAQCSRHPGCISPSLCSRGTPAKGTPGKGVQTYICQSITPTHYPANNQSPLASPLTPSPQSRGWSTPENFSSWPRKKRARIETCGSKEQVIKGVPLLEKIAVFEDPELSDVFRIPGVEELKESLSTPVSQRKLSLRSSQVMDHQYSPEGMDWTETVVQECDARDPTKSEPFVWMGRKVDTPKVKKPVSASGIFALTQSPLLYKKSAVSSEAAQLNGSRSELDISPLCQPRTRRTPSRTYSRKKLLD